MKRIATICLFEMKRTFKKRSAYVMMFAMPLLFTFIFGALFGSGSEKKWRLALVDEDRTPFSEQVVKRLMTNEMITFEPVGEEQAKEMLAGQEVQGVVTIGKDVAEKFLSKQQAIHLQFLPGTTAAPLIEQQIIRTIQGIDIYFAAAQVGSFYLQEDWESIFDRLTANDGQIHAWTEQGSISRQAGMTGISYSSAGFAIMFVMMMMLSMTGILIEMRQTGIWSRLFLTPATRIEILAGYFLTFFLVGWIQFFLLIVLSSVLFGVEWGDPIGLLALITSLLLCVVGLGIAIAGFVKTAEQQNAIGTLVIISTCMLGGVYWPISMVPDMMQKIANFVPQAWAMEGFTELIMEGGAVGDIMTSNFVLLGFAAVFLSIGLSRMRYV
ncbi:ABC transporter permease [Sporosarcina sp. Marseille-Q4943]|uniref:ABC transporter permease n=1 Tax=Sporosarcina sp. Marseille-Q4943 TaxID=2942204 RepID=UPI00208DAC4F|nr:ABC transporter permease [Sporosarcina sp. Marseille-Q4943]